MKTFPDIDRLKATLDQHRPLDPAIVRNLREDLIVRWTYHSNAIEGNTLTLQETKVALEGITIGGKSIREHLEAVNHKNAILLLEDLVQKNEPLTEWTINSLHQLILKGIDDDNAGRYRTVAFPDGTAGGCGPVTPPWLDTLLAGQPESHPVAYAAFVYHEMMRIRPFGAKDGVVARLLMNLELMKAGYPPAVMQVNMTSETKGSVDMVARIAKAGFRPYFHALSLPWEEGA
jgi:Fic family protein